MPIIDDYDHSYMVVTCGGENLEDLVYLLEQFIFGKDYINHIGVGVRLFTGYTDQVGIKLDLWEDFDELKKQYILGLCNGFTRRF